MSNSMNNDALDTSDKLIRNKNWPQEGSGPSLDEGAASKRHTVPLPESGLVEEMNGRVSGDKNMNSSMNSGSSSRPRSTGSTGQQYKDTSGMHGANVAGMMAPPPLDGMTMDRRGSGSHPDHPPTDQDQGSALLYGNGGGGQYHPHNSAPPLSHPNNPYAHPLDTSGHGGGGGSTSSPYSIGGGRDGRSGAGSALPFTDNMVAAAKIRAAGMAAAAAERDYQYAALNLQRQLEAAELAKKRHHLLGGGFPGAPGGHGGHGGGPGPNGGVGTGRPGGNPHGPPVEDDLEVAQACLNLRQDLKEDPEYMRFLQSRNLLHSGMLLPGGAGGRSDRIPGAAAAAAAAAARGMMHHQQQHHPSPMDSHLLGGGPGGAPNLSMMDPSAHPSGHFYPPMVDGFDAAHRSASMGLGMSGGVAGGMKSDPYGMMVMPGMSGADAKFNAMHRMGNPGGHMNDIKKERKQSRPEIPRKETKKGKRPADMPRRPLSAYNFFFSEERERVLAALPDPSGQKEGEASKEGDVATNEDKDAKLEGEGSKKDDTTTATTSEMESTKSVKEESAGTNNVEATKDSESAEKEAEKKQSNTERLLALRNSQRNVRRPHRKTHGKIGFKALAKLIGERWRALPPEKREYYTKLAETDLARYKEQMKEYHRKNKWSFLQQGKDGTASN